MATNNTITAKLILIGDVGVGKSSIFLRFTKDLFTLNQVQTEGVAFWAHNLAVNDETTVKFEIWDTAGQERYKSLAVLYFRNAAAAIIVYDITSANSYMRAKTWLQELRNQDNSNMVIALAGNKVDLEARRKVTTEEARSYAFENNLFFLETSAKNATNVNEIFSELAQSLLRAQPPPIPGVLLLQRPANVSLAARWWTCYLF